MNNSTQALALNKRPRAAYVVFLSQIIWGFGYYGVYALLTSFFKRGLEYSEIDTIAMVAAYGAMGPICTFIGGIVSDRLLGVRRSYIFGYFLYSFGFGILALSAFLVTVNRTLSISISIIAVAMLSIARGTANSSANIVLTKSHQNEDKVHLLDVSYSVNYMLNNIGSTLGQAVFPILIGTSLGLLWGYRVGFSLAAFLMLFAVINQALQYKHLLAGGSHLDEKRLPLKNILILIVYFIVLFTVVLWVLNQDSSYFSNLANALFCFAVLYFIYLITQADKSFRPKMVIALIIYFQLILFYIYYNQMFTSLILYPINVMRTVNIFGITINGEFTLMFNPFWCVVGSPIVIWIINALSKKGKEIHVGHKFVIGMGLAALSYFILWYSTVVSIKNGAQDMSILWMFAGHAFVGIAELFILNLAISSLSILVPKNITSTTLGMNLLTMGLGSLFAGRLASQIALEKGVEYTPTEIFTVYQPFFLKLAIMASIVTVIFFFTTYIMKYLERKALEMEK